MQADLWARGRIQRAENMVVSNRILCNEFDGSRLRRAYAPALPDVRQLRMDAEIDFTPESRIHA